VATAWWVVPQPRLLPLSHHRRVHRRRANMCLYSIFELSITLKDGVKSISSLILRSKSTAAAHARVRGKEQGTRYLEHTGETQRAYSERAERKTLLIFILARNQARRHWVYSGNYPKHLSLPRTHETQKPSVSQGLYQSCY
jgi:hypothetical protein